MEAAVIVSEPQVKPPRRIAEAPSARNIKPRRVSAVRRWPRRCGRFPSSSPSPSLSTPSNQPHTQPQSPVAVPPRSDLSPVGLTATCTDIGTATDTGIATNDVVVPECPQNPVSHSNDVVVPECPQNPVISPHDATIPHDQSDSPPLAAPASPAASPAAAEENTDDLPASNGDALGNGFKQQDVESDDEEKEVSEEEEISGEEEKEVEEEEVEEEDEEEEEVEDEDEEDKDEEEDEDEEEVGLSNKRWMISKVFPPPKRRCFSAIHRYPSGCRRDPDFFTDKLDISPDGPA